MVDATWPSGYKETDPVSYSASIDSSSTDWASTNTPKTNSTWKQSAYLPPLRDGARKSVRFKMTFGYRPPGLSSGPLEGPEIHYELLPSVAPLPPGTYKFTCVVTRTVAGGVPETARQEFDVNITGSTKPIALSGIESSRVYQRNSKASGSIAFYCTAPADQSIQVTLTREGGTSRSFDFKSAGKDQLLTLPDVATGGPYSVEVRAGEAGERFTDIWVGDIWVIGGQSNAVGAGGDLNLGRKPIPGVNGLSPRYSIYEWRPAQDGFFENTVGSWVTAAQNFRQATGVPVGLVGFASGSKAMDYFLDRSRKDVPLLKPLIERHARHAAFFFWYQGESDSFNEASCAAYGEKLGTLAAAMRRDTGNPDLKINIIQLAKYLWKKDAHFSPIREAQRQFVLKNPGAVLYSTLPHAVNEKDKIHLVTPSYIQLGEQIGKNMIEWEKTGRLVSPGPQLEKVTFSTPDRKEITALFNNAESLSGGDQPDQWYVTDASHQGFGSSGFVPVTAIRIDAPNHSVVLTLGEPAGNPAQLSYGYRADIGGTLQNGGAHPAPAFVQAPVELNP